MIPNALAAQFTAGQLDSLAYLFHEAARSDGGLERVSSLLFDAHGIATGEPAHRVKATIDGTGYGLDTWTCACGETSNRVGVRWPVPVEAHTDGIPGHVDIDYTLETED